MTDAEKLEELADWFDWFDITMPGIVEAVSEVANVQGAGLTEATQEWTSSDEVQQDLRRIARELRNE